MVDAEIIKEIEVDCDLTVSAAILKEPATICAPDALSTSDMFWILHLAQTKW